MKFLVRSAVIVFLIGIGLVLVGIFLTAMRTDQGEVFGFLALDIKLSLVHFDF